MSVTRPRRLLAHLLGIICLLAATAAARAADPVPIAPGATHTEVYRPDGPWAIHIVSADLSQPYLDVRAVLAGGQKMGRQALSRMLPADRPEEERLVAAVNGDFFALDWGEAAIIPLGFQVTGGELVTLPDPYRSVFYVLDDRTPHIGRFRPIAWLVCPDGVLYPIAALNRMPGNADLVVFTPRFGPQTLADADTTQIALVGFSGPLRPDSETAGRVAAVVKTGRLAIPPDGAVLAARGVAAYALRNLKVGDEVRLRMKLEPEAKNVVEAIGGGPRLVRDGRVCVEVKEERFADSFASRRHPRTGVGLKGNTVFLVTVDGRQPGYSEGMTLYEFAQLFVDLGCTDAMNLDGGGSTAMVVRNRLVNSPSGGAERAVVNALALFSTAPAGPPAWLVIEPAQANVLSGDQIDLTATALDEYYNPARIDRSQVCWQAPRGLGTIDNSGRFQASEVESPTVGLVLAQYGNMTASSVVRVLPAPARLVVVPSQATLPPGGSQQFTARAYDGNSRLIPLAADRVAWSAEPAGAGTMAPDGTFRAAGHPGRVTIIARVRDVTGQAQVVIGAASKVVEDFERAGKWSYQSIPASLPGGVSVVQDPTNPQNHCLRLAYDFTGATGTRAAYAHLELALPECRSFSVRVMGDGQGGWLRARLRDAGGRSATLDVSPHVDWSGQWREFTVWLPEDAATPVVLESLYVTEYRADRKPAGEILFDDIRAAVIGPTEQPTTPAAPPQPMPTRAPASISPTPRVPTLTCYRTPEPVTVDGSIGELVWARTAPVALRAAGEEGPEGSTQVRACWDDGSLYLSFVSMDRDIWATLRGRDADVFSEEAIGVDLCPSPNSGAGFQIGVNPLNTVCDASVLYPASGERASMTENRQFDCEGLRSAVQMVGTTSARDDLDYYWVAELAFPFSSIGREGRAPADGESWRADFFRIDRAPSGERVSSWSAPRVAPGKFQLPGLFGRLVFSTQIR